MVRLYCIVIKQPKVYAKQDMYVSLYLKLNFGLAVEITNGPNNNEQLQFKNLSN